MNPKQTNGAPPPGMTLGDIYYILFRRKWVIIVCSICGFIAAGITLATWQPTYSSMAELYISRITESGGTTDKDPDVVVTPTGNPANVLESEVEIMRSLDNLKKVARILTPAKIMAKYVTGTNATEDQAAQLIQQNLTVQSPQRSQIIVVTYSSRASDIVQPVLEHVITNYIERHVDIHRRPPDEDLAREYNLRTQDLKETEDKIRDLKTSLGIVVPIQQEEEAFKQQQGQIEQENRMAVADLREDLARANRLRSMLPATNQSPATNAAAAPVATAPSEEAQHEYQEAKRRLMELENRLSTLELQYTTNNSKVQTNLLDIEVARSKVRKLEDENPGLLTASKAAEQTAIGAPPAFDAGASLQSVMVRIEGLEAKTNEYATLLRIYQDRGTNLNHLEQVMGDLERLKAMQEAELNKVSISMEDTKIKGAAEKHRGENITVIQNPSPPGSDSRKSNKVVGGIAAGGVVSGLVLAFLWEILLDRSLRRPKEVAERLKLPVFLNIPYMKNGKGRISFLNPGGKVKMLSGGGPGGDAPSGNGAGEAAAVGNGPPALRDENHALRPFHETLRDRLVAYFEMLNLTHKPKLVAVTSCTEGAGVSTIAAGLACSLSETGEGNVLLVDMNDGDGVAHHFYKGKLAMGLDDILEKEKANRKGALMQENLYVVTETNHSDKLPSVLPKRFGHLVSQLKASDYDYILLDMPPVTEISITPRLARFMDTILLVVESEKTDRDAAQRAATLLSEGRTNVGVVINKSRSYVPQRLHHEV